MKVTTMVFNTLTKKYAIFNRKVTIVQHRCGQNYSIEGKENIEAALALMKEFERVPANKCRLPTWGAKRAGIHDGSAVYVCT